MKFRIFLDTNVFIYSFEFPNSNSGKIIELLNKGVIEVVISDRVIKEVNRYFEKFYDISLARKFRRYLLENCVVVMGEDVADEMKELKGKIKDKDLQQLAVVRKYAIKFLVSLDKDFDGIEEYIIPQKFLQLLEEDFSDTLY